MDEPRQEPLARARLALDQDGRKPGGVALPLEDLDHLRADGLDRRALSQEVRQRLHGPRTFRMPHSQVISGGTSIPLMHRARGDAIARGAWGDRPIAQGPRLTEGGGMDTTTLNPAQKLLAQRYH